MATKIAKKSIVGRVLTISFAHGKTLDVKVDDFSDAMKEKLMMHGLSAKVGDSYSDDKTPTAAMETATAEVAKLKRDVWAERGTGLVIEAIAKVKKITVKEAEKLWEAADDDKREAIKKHQAVRDWVTTIRGERAKAKLSEDVTVDF